MAEYIYPVGLEYPDDFNKGPFLFRYVVDLPPSLLAEIQKLQPNYALEYSKTVDEIYYMNICNCGELFEDQILQTHGGAFRPYSEFEATTIELIEFHTESDIHLNAEYRIGNTCKIVFENAVREKKQSVQSTD